MPDPLLNFLASYLVFVEAAIAGVLIVVFIAQARADPVRWVIGAFIVLTVSGVLAVAGSHLYYLPPVQLPVPVDGHRSPNSFPSHHALLAASAVAVVALISVVWSLPLALLTVIVDLALVANRDHHPADIIASDIFVAVAFAIAVVLTPRLTQLVKRAWRPVPGRNGRAAEWLGGSRE